MVHLHLCSTSKPRPRVQTGQLLACWTYRRTVTNVATEEMALTPDDAERVVATLAPEGIARQRVFGVLLRHLTIDTTQEETY